MASCIGRTPASSPREIAANLTLRAAAAALVAPADAWPMTAAACVAVTTACAPLQTRVGLVQCIAAPIGTSPPCVAYDVMQERVVPLCLSGVGPMPDRTRIEIAGERALRAWRRWAFDPDAGDDPFGAAGAAGLAAWCAWATGESVRALERASLALRIAPGDMFACLVENWVANDVRPAWTTSSTLDAPARERGART
jgi:hypothetical protein